VDFVLDQKADFVDFTSSMVSAPLFFSLHIVGAGRPVFYSQSVVRIPADFSGDH
jgi:hypothetical protein